jgi:hypothetical protein
MTTTIAVLLPTPGIRKGETRVPCVHCLKLGPAVKLPSGKSVPTQIDLAMVKAKYASWGWKADERGPCCPSCQGIVH